ncbi:MAG: hypothetical protein LWX07_04165 [Bacteroidetes bacterium]|nr:hypothetical protein [Bacteroidota bacterium]
MNALGTYTYKKVINDIVDRLNAYTTVKEKFPANLMREEIYLTICEVLSMLGIATSPDYKSSFILTSSGMGLVYADPVTNRPAVSYTNSTKALVIPTSGDGITWTHPTGMADGFNDFYAGMNFSLVWYDSEDNLHTSLGTVSSVISSSSVVLSFTQDDPGANIDNKKIAGFGIQTIPTDIISLDAYTQCKSIDKIESVVDSITGVCAEMDSEKKFYGIKKESGFGNYDDEIIWIKQGNMLLFFKGANITNYGTRTLNYIRTPIKPSLNSEFVDIKDEYLSVVKDRVIIKAMESLAGQGKLSDSGANALAMMKKSNLEEKQALNKSAEN